MCGVLQYSIPGYKCVPLLQALNGYQLDEEEDDPTAKQENQTERYICLQSGQVILTFIKRLSKMY